MYIYMYMCVVQVLKGVTVGVASGQTVAVVGATGSGKSTLGHLLLRLYDVTDGQVHVHVHVCCMYVV